MHEVHSKTQFVKNSVIDRQPVQLLQSWSYVVTQVKVENKPSCCVVSVFQCFWFGNSKNSQPAKSDRAGNKTKQCTEIID